MPWVCGSRPRTAQGAITCAASFARLRDDPATADFVQEYADFLECHVDDWTVTTQGTLVPGVPRHYYIRIKPFDPADPDPDEDPDRGELLVKNRGPGERTSFPAKEIVDAGFLELVRYGVRSPTDPLIEDSLRVVDAVLRVETPVGPCFRRYNEDGYGEHTDGAPYEGWGKGRAWPLLTGERAHLELAAGRDVTAYVRALEGFATETGLLPEQVWDEADRPELGMFLGRPTGAAMPLMWAHAEYVKLLRSITDGRVFDLVPAVAERYLGRRQRCAPLEVWKPNRRVGAVRPGMTLRVQAPRAFRLRWTKDEWGHAQETTSTDTALGISHVDLPVPLDQAAPLRFTFLWLGDDRWEGRDFAVSIDPDTDRSRHDE